MLLFGAGGGGGCHCHCHLHALVSMESPFPGAALHQSQRTENRGGGGGQLGGLGLATLTRWAVISLISCSVLLGYARALGRELLCQRQSSLQEQLQLRQACKRGVLILLAGCCMKQDTGQSGSPASDLEGNTPACTTWSRGGEFIFLNKNRQGRSKQVYSESQVTSS